MEAACTILDEWRRPLSLRARKPVLSSIRVSPMSPEFKVKHASCLAAHTSQPALAVISSDGSHGRNSLQVLKTILPGDGSTDFVPTAHTTQEAAFDACWCDNLLLCGCARGTVNLYRTGSEVFASGGALPEPTKFVIPKYRDAKFTEDPPSPGVWMASSRINRVSVSQARLVFLALHNEKVYLWEAKRPEKPIQMYKGSAGPLLAADWNPTRVTEFVLGGTTESLKILDARMLSGTAEEMSKAVVWKHSRAHEGCIREVKWSPLVDHWIASAGEDALIKVWDIRKDSKPVLELEGHTNQIWRLSWSRAHADILASGSTDRRINIWSLRIPPDFLLCSQSEYFAGPVVGVQFSHTTPGQVYGLSEEGSVVSIMMTQSFLEPLITSRFKANDTREREIEKYVYLRDLSQAGERAVELASKHLLDGKAGAAMEVLELVHRKPIKENSTFEDDLRTFSYFLPPNMRERMGVQLDQTLCQKINALSLHASLLEHLGAREYAQIVEREEEIKRSLADIGKFIEGLGPDPLSTSFFGVHILQRVIQELQPRYSDAALAIGIRVCEVLETLLRSTEFVNVASMLLQPTIYENDPPMESTTKHTHSSLHNPKDGLRQLHLLEDFNALIKSPVTAHRVVELIRSEKVLSISSTLQEAYFNLLLKQEMYDELFIHFTKLAQHLKELQGNGPAFDYEVQLRGRMTQAAFPALRKYISTVLEHSAENARETAHLRRAALMIINILWNCHPLSDTATQVLPQILSKLKTELEFALRSRSGQRGQSLEAASILEEVERLREESTDEMGRAAASHREIEEFVAMLKRT